MPEDVFEIVGSVVGGAYNVEAVVAEGGFAVVYRAYHGAFHAPVALKCLKVPNVKGADQREFLERFREEGEVLFRLSMSIPAVVRPLHVDAFENARGVFIPYMALEWLEGESLDVLIARRREQGLAPLSPRRVVRLLAPVARALDRAHKFPGPNGPVSIIHRDLKPDNIVVATVNGEEVVKVLDFGIAKVKSVASQAAGRMSQDGSQAAVPFTPGYAAPEQWFPKRFGQTGPWTDVWGLALSAVEAMSGKAAIDGDHAAMMGTAVDEKRRPTPRTEGVQVPDAVEAIFRRALAVDPRDRYQDVGRFWDDLEAALGIPRMAGYTGMGPQPYRDPRSEGPPPALEERIEAADAQQREHQSIRPPNVVLMSHRQRGAATVEDPAGAVLRAPAGMVAAESLEVPDLELGTAAPPSQRRSQGRARQDIEVASERGEEARPPVPSSDGLELELPKPPDPLRTSAVSMSAARVSGSMPVGRPEPLQPGLSPSAAPGVSVPAAADAQVSVSKPPTSVQGPAVSQVARGAAGEVEFKPVAGAESKIDLAVSPAEVRRISNAQMRAVRPPAPGAGGPAGRGSGAMPAVTTSVPIDLATPPVNRTGQQRAAPTVAALAPSKPQRKIALPIVLMVLGLLIAIAYYINASAGYGRWALGPVPVNWIAAVLVVSGAALLLARLFWQMED